MMSADAHLAERRSFDTLPARSRFDESNRQSARAGVASERTVERPEVGAEPIREHRIRGVVGAPALKALRHLDDARSILEAMERDQRSPDEGSHERDDRRQRVWRLQLGLESEEAFWETLRTGDPPARGVPQPEPREPSMPTWLADYLIHRMGREEDEVLGMSEKEAMQLYVHYIQGEAPA